MRRQDIELQLEVDEFSLHIEEVPRVQYSESLEQSHTRVRPHHLRQARIARLFLHHSLAFLEGTSVTYWFSASS